MKEAPTAVENQGKKAEELLKGGTPLAGGGGSPTAPKTLENMTPEEKAAYWEQKYSVLDGKYKNEVPRIQQELADLKDLKDIVNKQALTIDELKAAKIKVDVKTPEGLAYLRREMPELEEAIVFLAQDVINTTLEEKMKPVSTKLTEMETSTVKNAESRFYDTLNIKVPDWVRINESADFLSWLVQIDRYTGKSRKMLLLEAYNRFDATTASAFFLDFKKEAGISNTERFLEPPQGGDGGEPLTPNATDVITRAFIEKFYKDISLGYYKNNEEEARKIEGRINNAIAKNQVA